MRKMTACSVRFGAGLPAALAAALLLAVSGCSLTLDTSKLDPLSTPQGYCQVLFDEYLRLLTSCHPATPQWFDIQYERMASMCGALAASESRGAIVYDQSAARAWIDKVRNASCTDKLDDVMYKADSPFVGQIPDGGDCGEKFECADDRAECRSVDATCPGTCLAPGTLGAPCYAGYPECDVGYYCGSTGACAAAIQTGGDCSGNPGGCGTGAYCWYCASTCIPQNQCRPYVTEGGTCNSTDRQCDPYAPAAWLFCDDLNSGTCKRGGSLVVGQLCSAGECDGSAFCAGSPSICRSRLGYGSQCVSDECMPPFECIDDWTGVAGLCQPPKQVGEQCLGGSYDCALGAYCTSPSGTTTGSCQPWPSAYGAACGAVAAEWVPCLTGWCDTGGLPGPGMCRPFLSPGSSCAGSSDACGSNGPGQTAWCDWATVAGNAVQVCVPGCLTP